MTEFRSKRLEQPAPQPPTPAPATPPAAVPVPDAPALAIQLAGDPADASTWPQMPARAARKLRELRSERDAARAVARAIKAEEDAVRAKRLDIVQRLERLAPSAPFAVKPHPPIEDGHPALKAARAALADCDSEIERVGMLVAERSKTMQQHARLISALEDYCSRHLRSRKTVEVHDGAAPELKSGEDAAAAVERCRRRVRELSADAHRIKSAPWHASHAKQRMREEVARLAARGEPSVLALIESSDGGVAWRERVFHDVLIGGRLLTNVGDPGALALMFWLHHDAIVQRLEALIDEQADDQNALTLEQRSEQLAEIARDLLATEREEAYWTDAAIAAGAAVLHRADLDPRAALMLSSSLPQP